MRRKQNMHLCKFSIIRGLNVFRKPNGASNRVIFQQAMSVLMPIVIKATITKGLDFLARVQ